HAPARGDELAFQQGDAPGDVLGAEVYVHGRPVLERAIFAGKQAEFDIDALRRCFQRRRQQPVAAADLFHGQALAREVHRDALAGVGLLRLAVLRMQAAYANPSPTGAQGQLVADLDTTGEGGSGDDHAGAGHAERAVDGQAKMAARTACAYNYGLLEQGLAQRVDALPGDG